MGNMSDYREVDLGPTKKRNLPLEQAMKHFIPGEVFKPDSDPIDG